MSHKRSATGSPSLLKRCKTSLFDPKSQFITILKSCGLAYSPDDDTFTLHHDNASFSRSLSSHLTKNEEDIVLLTNCLTSLCKNDDCLVKLLASVKSTDPSLGFSLEISVIRLLLDNPKLYCGIIEIIVELIYSISSGMRKVTVDMDVPSLLLMQLRWLPSSSDFCDFTLEKLLDLIDVTNDQIRGDIILILPDILFKDSQALKTVERLKQLLLSNSELAPCILEVLSNLCVPHDSLVEIQDISLNLLQSTEIGATPVLIKFLLQTVDKDRRVSILPELRSGLDFTAYTINVINIPGISTSAKNNLDESLDLIVANILQTSFLFQKELENDWIKMMQRIDKPDKHNFSDFIVLLILLSIANNPKSIIALCESKIRSNCLNQTIVRDFFSNHREIAQHYFNSVIKLCECLLSNKETKLNTFGSFLIQESFSAMDVSYQQKLIVLLVTLISMKSTFEVDLALQTLLKITAADPDRVSTFEVFFTSLIDGMEQMSTNQIRLLYSAMSCLAFRTSKKLRIQNELLILLKKQLSNLQSSFKCIGVIGAITAIEYLMSSPLVDLSGITSSSQLGLSQTLPSTSSSSADYITNSGLKTVINLLQLIRQNYAKFPEVGSLYMDELGRSLARGTMDSQIEEWVSEKILQNFQDDFLCGNGEAEKPFTQYYLDDSSVCEITVNIGPLWSQFNNQQHKRKTSKDAKSKCIISPACLSPHFRLLVLCERKHKGNLSEIDALLSCPILLDSDSTDPMPTLLAINWIIEVINAFCNQEALEMKQKVLLRLKDLIKLRIRFQEQLCAVPNIALPIAAYEAGISTIKLPIKATEKKVKSKLPKPKQSKSKQSKLRSGKTQEADTCTAAILVADTQGEPLSTQPNTADNNREKKVTSPGLTPSEIKLDSISNVFREFDIDVAGLLSLDLSESDSDSHSLTLDQPEIHLLIEDLSNKARHLFPTSCLSGLAKSKQTKLLIAARFRNLDNQTKPVLAEKFIGFIPSLCKHLETAAEYFKVDGNVDDDDDDEISQITSHTQLVDAQSDIGKFNCAIMSHILDIFHHLLKWLFDSAESSPGLLKKALACFAGRMADPSSKLKSGSAGYVVLLDKSCQYFQQFSPNKLCHIQAALILSKIVILLKQSLEADDAKIHRASHSTDTVEKMDVHDMTKLLLNREWDEALECHGRRFRESLQSLINLHFTTARNSLAFLKTFVESELTNVLKEDSVRSTNYLQLTKKNFGLFYKQSLEYLAVFCKTIRNTGTIASERCRQKQFECWSQCFLLLSILSDMERENADRLAALLKFGSMIIQTVIKDAMPLLDAMFRTNSNSVMHFLKSIQKVTRFMQHICNHGKIHQNIILTRKIPTTKKCLENFIYRVKMMLTRNECLQAFWFGNLKNKTLHGEVIESDEDVELSEADQELEDVNDSESEVESRLSDASDS